MTKQEATRTELRLALRPSNNPRNRGTIMAVLLWAIMVNKDVYTPGSPTRFWWRSPFVCVYNYYFAVLCAYIRIISGRYRNLFDMACPLQALARFNSHCRDVKKSPWSIGIILLTCFPDLVPGIGRAQSWHVLAKMGLVAGNLRKPFSLKPSVVEKIRWLLLPQHANLESPNVGRTKHRASMLSSWMMLDCIDDVFAMVFAMFCQAGAAHPVPCGSLVWHWVRRRSCWFGLDKTVKLVV